MYCYAVQLKPGKSRDAEDNLKVPPEIMEIKEGKHLKEQRQAMYKPFFKLMTVSYENSHSFLLETHKVKSGTWLLRTHL